MVKNFKDFNISANITSFVGEKIKIKKIIDEEIVLLGYKIDKSKFGEDRNCLTLHLEFKNIKRIVFTSSKPLMQMIEEVNKDNFSFKTTIIEINEHFEFS